MNYTSAAPLLSPKNTEPNSNTEEHLIEGQEQILAGHYGQNNIEIIEQNIDDAVQLMHSVTDLPPNPIPKPRYP